MDYGWFFKRDLPADETYEDVYRRKRDSFIFFAIVAWLIGVICTGTVLWKILR
jgi:hypothetical protein